MCESLGWCGLGAVRCEWYKEQGGMLKEIGVGMVDVEDERMSLDRSQKGPISRQQGRPQSQCHHAARGLSAPTFEPDSQDNSVLLKRSAYTRTSKLDDHVVSAKHVPNSECLMGSYIQLMR